MQYLFKSERLGFRTFKEQDYDILFNINSSPKCMEFFINKLDSNENKLYIEKLNKHYDDNGYTLFCVEILDTGEFIGLIGLLKVSFDLEIKNQVEIGWRVHHKYWGNGYAQEGAKAVLDFGFNKLNLDTIYAFTSNKNTKSINVMKKIGMSSLGVFEHPLVPKYSSLLPHVLYEIRKPRL